ncbi:MAG TPA: glycosyltransferase, partial [Puia sp.]|nr:glycosyltransferase [Puia sp.]
SDYISWYYAPMAMAYTTHLKPGAMVYDCMDELSAFKFAPPELIHYEKQLLSKADVVFTGGYRLFEAKKHLHKNIHAFPSAIDKNFFLPARTKLTEPPDQNHIARPRLGFFGVIDERFDIELVREMAAMKPGWQFIFIGPVVKIDPADLPVADNIHYLGMKNYKELPSYISGWDVCIMPFAINASTEFISPTKTPEFLAAGKRVISTKIHDVIYPYGEQGLVGIAQNAKDFIQIAEKYLDEKDSGQWLEKADEFLNNISWDKTWHDMESKISEVIRKKKGSEKQLKKI